MATEAARAFASGTPTRSTCPGGSSTLSISDGTNWATWAYSGLLAGYVHLAGSPTCPDTSSPTWD